MAARKKQRPPTPQRSRAARLGLQLRRLGVITQWPTRWVIAAGLVCGLLTTLNQATFDFPTIWKTTVTVVLGLFAFLGIGPIMGPKFRAALHIPPKVAAAIGIALTLLLVVVQQNVGLPASAIIIGAINVAGALGFSPAFAPTV